MVGDVAGGTVGSLAFEGDRNALKKLLDSLHVLNLPLYFLLAEVDEWLGLPPEEEEENNQENDDGEKANQRALQRFG